MTPELGANRGLEPVWPPHHLITPCDCQAEPLCASDRTASASARTVVTFHRKPDITVSHSLGETPRSMTRSRRDTGTSASLSPLSLPISLLPRYPSVPRLQTDSPGAHVARGAPQAHAVCERRSLQLAARRGNRTSAREPRLASPHRGGDVSIAEKANSDGGSGCHRLCPRTLDRPRPHQSLTPDKSVDFPVKSVRRRKGLEPSTFSNPRPSAWQLAEAINTGKGTKGSPGNYCGF
jgi:hypothetical protein